MLRDLASIGSLVVRARVNDLPSFDELKPDLCALSWDIELATLEPEASIREVFQFVEDEATIEIGRIPSEEGWVLPPAAYFGADMIDGFIEESAEDIAEVEASVLALETNPEDATRIEALFRLLHNLKAQARLLLATCGVDPRRLTRFSRGATCVTGWRAPSSRTAVRARERSTRRRFSFSFRRSTG